jgi:Domain of unknown function (DUF4917)
MAGFDLTTEDGRRHLLLGNGFSRACRNDIFAYDALFERANFEGLSQTARAAFIALQTKDFELVMRALRQASLLLEVYLQADHRLVGSLREDASSLRDLLARTIASSHPDRPNAISDEQYAACRSFLYHFSDFYTVNYDLLLYWTLMQKEIEPTLKFDDGFRQPDDEPAEYVTWDVQKTGAQNLHYLHGGLHIFDAGSEVQKFTWSNTGIALVEQIREALATNRFPIFVAEGTPESKLDRIQHSGFLNRAFRSFGSIGGSLFVFGLSFSETDEHLLKLLDHGKVSNLFVSLHGDPDSENNARIVQRTEVAKARRTDRHPLTVQFFSAESTHVWG